MGQVEQFLEQFSKFTLYQGIGGCGLRFGLNFLNRIVT